MSNVVTVYHFWSKTCGPCQVIKPALQLLRTEFPEAKWVSVDIHQDIGGYASQFKVNVVPTVVVVVSTADGRMLGADRHSGTQMIGYHRILRNAMRAITPQ
jgi:thioredoxin-like negative regulator of GroEL